MGNLELDTLTKSWGDVTAVDQVSFTVDQGSLTVLLGPSGCGKSTVLRLIAGLEAASSGTVRINGKEVTHIDPAKRGVSMVFQSYALFPHLTVQENILFGLKVRKVTGQKRRERLSQAVDILGLEGLLDRKPAMLSGGQRQRVALARSIVSRRPVCLMDEPLSNLDARLRADMREEIRNLQQAVGLTMLYVTHDQVEAMTMADQVVLMNQGRVAQKGRPKDLYDRPETVFAATFMGAPPMNLVDPGQGFGEAALPHLALEPGTVTLGIRPEHVSFCSRGVAARIRSREYLGAETVFRIEAAGHLLYAKAHTPLSLAPGDRVHIRFDPDRLSCFDARGNSITGPGQHKGPIKRKP